MVHFWCGTLGVAKGREKQDMTTQIAVKSRKESDPSGLEWPYSALLFFACDGYQLIFLCNLSNLSCYVVLARMLSKKLNDIVLHPLVTHLMKLMCFITLLFIVFCIFRIAFSKPRGRHTTPINFSRTCGTNALVSFEDHNLCLHLWQVSAVMLFVYHSYKIKVELGEV